MWLKLLLVFGMALGICGSGVSFAGGEGAAIYESLRCGTCHKPDKRTVAASLGEIAKTYPDKGKLVQFLRSESRPMIESEKWGMMRGQMKVIGGLRDQEKEALADYVLSFK